MCRGSMQNTYLKLMGIQDRKKGGFIGIAERNNAELDGLGESWYQIQKKNFKNKNKKTPFHLQKKKKVSCMEYWNIVMNTIVLTEQGSLI